MSEDINSLYYQIDIQRNKIERLEAENDAMKQKLQLIEYAYGWCMSKPKQYKDFASEVGEILGCSRMVDEIERLRTRLAEAKRKRDMKILDGE